MSKDTRTTYPVFGSLPFYRNIIRHALIIALALVFGIFALKYLVITIRNLWNGDIHNDFFHIWSFSKFVIVNRPTEIYDDSILHEFQILLGGPAHKHAPYPYPPSFLLLIWPLGFISYYLAYGIWFFVLFRSILLHRFIDNGAYLSLLYQHLRRRPFSHLLLAKLDFSLLR